MIKTSRLLKITLTFIIFYIAMVSAFGQANNETLSPKEILQIADKEYGIDDRLNRGEIYLLDKTVLEGHPYFLHNKWFNGPIYIKGIRYDKVLIKYDTENDKIILLSKFSNGNVKQLTLNNKLVDSLYIDNHKFINARQLPIPMEGYLEPIYSGKIKAYKKHSIKFVVMRREKDVDDINLFGSYKEPSTATYVLYKGEWNRINTVKDLANLYDSNKKEIIQFAKKNRIKVRYQLKNQLVKLLRYCDELSPKN